MVHHEESINDFHRYDYTSFNSNKNSSGLNQMNDSLSSSSDRHYPHITSFFPGDYEYQDNFSPPIQSLCGEPGFCSNGIYHECNNVAIYDCKLCQNGLAAAFLTFVVCLGLGIAIGNLLIILIGFRRRKIGKMELIDLWKISLAVADLLTGIHLLTVVVYNFSWSLYATPTELIEYEFQSQQVPGPYVGGVLYLLGFVSSIYHLCFMTGLRLFAFVSPFKYKLLEKKYVIMGLVAIWIISAAAATVPGWFRSQVSFGYQVSLMLFFPILRSDSTGNAAPITTLALFYIFPYTMMTLFSIATAIVIRKRQQVKRSMIVSAKSSSSKSSSSVNTKQAISIFVTILLMELCFTVALIPQVVVTALFYTGRLNCRNISVPYITCAYFAMTNSAVNVVIYSVRDKDFRIRAKKMFFSCIPKCFQQEPSISQTQTHCTNQSLI